MKGAALVRKEVGAASLRLVFIENCAGKVMHPFIDDAGVSVDWWNPVRRQNRLDSIVLFSSY